MCMHGGVVLNHHAVVIGKVVVALNRRPMFTYGLHFGAGCNCCGVCSCPGVEEVVKGVVHGKVMSSVGLPSLCQAGFMAGFCVLLLQVCVLSEYVVCVALMDTCSVKD